MFVRDAESGAGGGTSNGTDFRYELAPPTGVRQAVSESKMGAGIRWPQTHTIALTMIRG